MSEKIRDLATDIVELFEDLLDKKGIDIPCADEAEQTERDDSNARLYGMEYWSIVDDVEALLGTFQVVNGSEEGTGE